MSTAPSMTCRVGAYMQANDGVAAQVLDIMEPGPTHMVTVRRIGPGTTVMQCVPLALLTDPPLRDDALQTLSALVRVLRIALDFAAGAIGDAVHLPAGLDRDAGQGVLDIITEAMMHGTFDEVAAHALRPVRPFERIAEMETQRSHLLGLLERLQAQCDEQRQLIDDLTLE